MSDCLVGPLGWFSLKCTSSGAVHRHEPPGPFDEDSVQLRLAMDDKPKSVRHAQPEPLIRMLGLLSKQGRKVIRGRLTGFEMVRTYAFEVTVDDVVIVKNLETVTDIEELGGPRENP